MSSDPNDRDEDAALRARLDRLSGDLKARKAASTPEPQPRSQSPDGMGSAMSMAMKAASEFVAAIIVAAGIGWAIDKGLGTSPAFIIVFFMLGVAGGVWNLIRATSPKGGPSERNSPLSPAEPTDKGLRRSAAGGEDNASKGRAASGRATGAPGWDDDED